MRRQACYTESIERREVKRALFGKYGENSGDSVLPKPAVRVIDPGFTPLFDGTASTFNSWKSADAKNGQGFALINGEIATYGSADFALLYLATKAFADFHLRLQFKCFDPNNNNSGVFVRFRDPRLRLPAGLASRADADKVGGNPAWSAVISGFEVQIDDNARGDVNKDFYGRRPEPDGLEEPNRSDLQDPGRRFYLPSRPI